MPKPKNPQSTSQNMQILLGSAVRISSENSYKNKDLYIITFLMRIMLIYLWFFHVLLSCCYMSFKGWWIEAEEGKNRISQSVKWQQIDGNFDIFISFMAWICKNRKFSQKWRRKNAEFFGEILSLKIIVLLFIIVFDLKGYLECGWMTFLVKNASIYREARSLS